MKPVVLVGPTAAGKSAAAMRICERYGATLVSMDAMQVYRGMDIGTAKPTPEEQARVRHVGIDIRNPDEPFNATDFRDLAESVEGPRVLCGGTTFYFRTWIQGVVPAPPADLVLRAELERLENPWQVLNEVDPVLAARLHPNDKVRLIRGIEVFRLSGRRLSDLHAEDPKTRRPAEVIWIDREDLEPVIVRRVQAMMQAGYLAEVERLRALGYGPEHKPMQSLGYKHLSSYLTNEITLEEAVQRTAIETRQLARRQRSFLRSWGLTPTCDGEPVDEAAARALGA